MSWHGLYVLAKAVSSVIVMHSTVCTVHVAITCGITCSSSLCISGEKVEIAHRKNYLHLASFSYRTGLLQFSIHSGYRLHARPCCILYLLISLNLRQNHFFCQIIAAPLSTKWATKQEIMGNIVEGWPPSFGQVMGEIRVEETVASRATHARSIRNKSLNRNSTF